MATRWEGGGGVGEDAVVTVVTGRRRRGPRRAEPHSSPPHPSPPTGARHAPAVRTALAVAVLLVLTLVTSCSNAPPPVVGQAPVVAPAPQFEPDPTQLRIGVDDLGVGFNPHRTAELTPTSRAAASLVLPSAFRIGADGLPQLDTTVVTSARVSATAPFTVSYEIAPAATWSDNAPIAAEDFVFLWQQMRSQPAVVSAAGYRAISDVRSRAGGKAVDVVFDRPYPAWPRLFDNLLPAHLLKDAPGAWGGALQDSIPVSGGPFAVRVVDRIRGQVTLARNDRYWATPAVTDEVVLQAAPAASLVDRVRTGDVQATQFRADGSALTGAGPGLVVRRVPEPQLVQLGLRSDAGPLADVRVRRAVAAALDRDALIADGTDAGPASDLRADAFSVAPSDPGYRSTMPADSPARAPDPERVRRELTAAGWTRGDDGRWSRDGRPLTLRVAAPPQASPYGRLLPALVQQLDAAGIGAVVVADGGTTDFPPGRGPIPTTTAAATGSGDASGGPVTSRPVGGGTSRTPTVPTTTPTTTATSEPPTGTTTPTTTSTTTSVPPIPDSPSDMVLADLTLLALPVGGDPVADLDSVLGCPSGRAPTSSGTPATVVASTATPAIATPTPSTTPTAPPTPSTGSSTSSSTTPPVPTELSTPRASEALSPSGFCDPTLQAVLDAASSGAMGQETALALAEPLLWRALPVVPLFQAASVLISPVDRRDVVVGPLGTSPLAGADRWPPPPRLARANGDPN